LQLGITALHQGLHLDALRPQALALYLFRTDKCPLSLLDDLLASSRIRNLVGAACTGKRDGTHGVTAAFTTDHAGEGTNGLLRFFPLLVQFRWRSHKGVLNIAKVRRKAVKEVICGFHHLLPRWGSVVTCHAHIFLVEDLRDDIKWNLLDLM